MKLIYGAMAFAWYGFISGGAVWWDSLAAFNLGMSIAQARAVCPRPLVTVYEKLHIDTHFLCDDGSRSTVLIFDEGKLAAIVDLKYFAKQPGNQ